MEEDVQTAAAFLDARADSAAITRPLAAKSRNRRIALASVVRLAAVLVFALTAFLPLHGSGPGPIAHEAKTPVLRARAPALTQVPREEMCSGIACAYRAGGALQAIWDTRIGYPYLLAPLWLLALALADAGARARRIAGLGLLAVAVGIAALELCYVTADFLGFLPVAVRPLEVAIVWFVVLSVLFVRVGGRSVADPGAAVSAQALLSLLHGFTFPIADARRWLAEGHPSSAIVSALLDDYRPAFWVAMAALALAAAPAYLPRWRPADASTAEAAAAEAAPA